MDENENPDMLQMKSDEYSMLNSNLITKLNQYFYSANPKEENSVDMNNSKIYLAEISENKAEYIFTRFKQKK
jgi:hypothetical protein